jgi:hypothetical protein
MFTVTSVNNELSHSVDKKTGNEQTPVETTQGNLPPPIENTQRYSTKK